MTERKIKEAGELNRQQFKEISAATASWTNVELNGLSSVLEFRVNIFEVFAAEKIEPIRHLFDETGRVKNNQIHILLQEVVRGHRLERVHAEYLVDHPLYTKKGNRYGK